MGGGAKGPPRVLGNGGQRPLLHWWEPRAPVNQVANNGPVRRLHGPVFLLVVSCHHYSRRRRSVVMHATGAVPTVLRGRCVVLHVHTSMLHTTPFPLCSAKRWSNTTCLHTIIMVGGGVWNR